MSDVQVEQKSKSRATLTWLALSGEQQPSSGMGEWLDNLFQSTMHCRKAITYEDVRFPASHHDLISLIPQRGILPLGAAPPVIFSGPFKIPPPPKTVTNFVFFFGCFSHFLSPQKQLNYISRTSIQECMLTACYQTWFSTQLSVRWSLVSMK